MTRFVEWWNSLSQGVRDTIVGGIAVAALVGVWKLSGKSIRALFRHIANKTTPPPPQPPQIIVNVPPAPVPPVPVPPPTPDAQHAPQIPKSPSVGFVVRRDENEREIVELLKESLSPTSSQLVALWGEGGHGKTTLAAEAARALSEAFKQRIVWASADKRADFTFSTLLDEIAVQLNHSDLTKFAIEPKAVEVQALIASAPTLIILDNFETIAEKERLRCVEFLAERSPYPSLITTRQKVDGAHNISVDEMTPAEAQEFLKRLIQSADNRNAFAGLKQDEIIAAAGHNPRVMEWIVGQIELAQHPRDVLRDLAGGKGDAAQRVFDRSFELEQLTDDGRAVLLALSLFVASASRPALAEVAGLDSDTTRLNEAVKRLASLRLIGTTEGGERLTIQGLTRELAKARLAGNERAAEFRQRFVAHFLSYAKAHAQRTPEEFDALEVEKDNVLSAMDGAFVLRDWTIVIQLMNAISFDGLNGFLTVRGYWDESIRRGEQALEAARNLSDERQIARFSHNLAIMYQSRGELTQARSLYNESLEIEKKLGNQSGIAITLHQLGRLAQDQGELAEARRLYDESLEIKKRLGDQSGIAITLHQLAMLAQDQGEIEEARRLYNESLEIEKRLGDQSGIASTLHQLGRLARAQGDIEEARRLYNESLEIKKRLGDQSGIAITLHALAIIERDQGELVKARRLYEESLEITERLGDKGNLALIFYNMGLLAEKEGDRTEATRLLRDALVIFEKLKSPYAKMVRRNLARLEKESS
jgi:tetratricopeptide (TPR) repeat protein